MTTVESPQQSTITLPQKRKAVSTKQRVYQKAIEIFNQLRGNRIIINSPEKDETINFWRPLFETEKATWLPEYINSTDNIIPATYTPITESEIQKATLKFCQLERSWD